MHRVDPKHRRTKALRIVAYVITLTLSVLTTVILLYIALGYRLDGTDGHVVRSGLLLVDNKPEAASIYVNNELKDNQTPGRFVLSAGSYELTLKGEGYRDWSKKVSVTASGVREVNYPLLIPTKLTNRQLLQFTAPSLISQSLDRKYVLTHEANQPDMLLTTLDPKEPKQTKVPLGAAITRENGQFGTFKVIEWSLNNKQVLLAHALPSGKSELLSLNVTKPEELVNISELYGAQTPHDIHYVGGDTDEIYGLSDGILRRYKLAANESETVLQKVASYQPYSDDTILFSRTLASQKNEIGIWKDKVTTVIQTNVDPALIPLLKYANYDGHYYFVVAFSNGNGVTIYKDPLKKPILAKQLPLVTLKFDNTNSLKFSDSSQFVLVQNGKNFQTYDLEDLRQFSHTLSFELAPASKLTWVDSHHLQAVSADNTAYLLDYDGLNQQSLVASRVGSWLYFAGNYQHAYRFIDGEGVVNFEAISLVSGKE